MHPWASHGIALGALNGNSMDVLYGQCIGISPWAFFGIALGLLIGECHGSVLWLAHWPFAHVHSMELQWCFSMGIPRKCAMGNSLGCTHGQPMELHWVLSMGIPWMCSMASALGFPHGPSLELHWDFSLGNAMAVFYG